jgi:hypothetical protein
LSVSAEGCEREEAGKGSKAGQVAILDHEGWISEYRNSGRRANPMLGRFDLTVRGR